MQFFSDHSSQLLITPISNISSTSSQLNPPKKPRCPPRTTELNLNSESDRVKSFNEYSVRNGINIQLLARIGLYYCTVTKDIKCHFCRYTLKEASTTEDIIQEHYQLSRRCPLMTRRRTANIPIDELELDLNLPPLVYDECGTGNNFPTCFYRELKYLNFRSLEERTKSFKYWPEHLRQTPEVMAESGLFYTNEADKVKCYDCGLGLNAWEEQDDPWHEHARYSKNCRYLKFVRGDEWMERIKKNGLGQQKDDRTEEEIKVLEENNGCRKCNKRLAEVVCLPCNHKGICAICAKSDKDCFVCGETVECFVRLFYYH